MGRKAKDIKGQKFGRLTVLNRADRPFNVNNQYAYWRCVCDCDVETVVMGANLRAGSVKSCGCLLGENLVKINKTHGMSSSSEFHIWKGIKDRCYNPKMQNYLNYGGRGIRMCNKGVLYLLPI